MNRYAVKQSRGLDGPFIFTSAGCAVYARIHVAGNTGIGCGTAGRFCLPLLIAAIFLELRSVPTAVEPTPEGWREVAQIFRDMARPGDAVYINYAGAVLPLRQYGWPEAQLDIKVYATSDKEPWFRGRLWPIVDPTEIADDAVRLGRVWLVAYGRDAPIGWHRQRDRSQFGPCAASSDGETGRVAVRPAFPMTRARVQPTSASRGCGVRTSAK